MRQCTYLEYNKVLPLRKRAAGPTGPLISESEFSGIETTPPEPEVERMVYQVVGVLPHVPVQVVRQDLSMFSGRREERGRESEAMREEGRKEREAMREERE